MRCKKHGGNSSSSECDTCLLQELNEKQERVSEERRELAEEAREASRENAEHSAWLSNNPGEYECPACRMQSLKWFASRCPICQKDVPVGFWPDIVERNKREEARIKKNAEIEKKWKATPEYTVGESLRKELNAIVVPRLHEFGALERWGISFFAFLFAPIGVPLLILWYFERRRTRVAIPLAIAKRKELEGKIQRLDLGAARTKFLLQFKD